MIRFTPLMVAVAATLAVSSAQALVIVVDDFNSPNALVIDSTGGDATAAVYSDTTRTIRHRQITASATTNVGQQSSTTLGGSSDPVGTLGVANANNITSEVTLEWSLTPFLPLANPASLYFKVFSSDDVEKTITATASFGDIGSFTLNFVAAPGQTVSFALSPVEVGFLNSGGTFSLSLIGDRGWDISLDEVGFTIPEPSVLGLAGLALMGAGLASRRRRA